MPSRTRRISDYSLAQSMAGTRYLRPLDAIGAAAVLGGSTGALQQSPQDAADKWGGASVAGVTCEWWACCWVIDTYFPNTVFSRSLVRAAGLVRIFFSSSPTL